MRTRIRYGIILVAAGSFTPAWGSGMTKHEPTPPPASESKQTKDTPASEDGSRVSGNMYKDDQDEVRANAKKKAKKAKKATPPAASEAEQAKQGEPAANDGSRVSGNMYKDDQDEVRAKARKEAARKARRTPPAGSDAK